MKKIELRLVSELLKNCRRSDRELGKVLGVSQPTVSRMIKKLEKQGVIREYTIVPDLGKLGFGLLALNFVKLRSLLKSEGVRQARESAKELVTRSSFGIVMLERGMGLAHDGVLVSVYKDFSEYGLHKEAIRRFPFIDGSKTETFLIDLHDDLHYRPLTFRPIAQQLAKEDKASGLE